ncbi:NTP pyrophosphohydrolase [Desulfosporosinus orientis DSM 765]|uniref:NTP pyrophosphohydrolase n=1 Tax=Desulfosporosinus orientis (strain ATCC 19365 / DSM 765 / NCIMB 8382 / VKM B-1628 / Singapore I) TaxID=768706 RepID=G7W808_DESOD|nr:CoA pyrophosphatase [Desulfosporosinus orientis]AET66434.1 NTP pyrophosphohydrolase [Desulfosporosinus orientis DSM 765]
MDKVKLQELVDNMPAIPGINGKEEYFNSAVLVLLMLMDEEYHFVFQKRSATIRQAGEICFPGGKFDPDKDSDFKETALRETSEELGVPYDKICIVGVLDTVISNMGTTVDAFLGILNIKNLEELNINPSEVERIFSVPVSYFEETEPEIYQVCISAQPSYINEAGEEVVLFPAKELGLPERYTKPWGNSVNKIYVYRVAGETIWGITARLIRDVISRIK